MKIVLIGYMASGKSAIGKLLASKLNRNYIDLDEYIENKEKKSIAKLFADKGEIYFRKVETIYLRELLENNINTIISVGGGTPCFGNNINEIKKNAKSIYLKASIKAIYDRLLLESEKRPLVSEIPENKLEEFIAKHLFERRSFYGQADFTVEVTNKNLDEIVAEILQLI
jgi:shikimate kinase